MDGDVVRHRPAYAFHRRFLQYLQHQFHRADVKPWLLKSPPNLGFERELARNLPGAKFVVLHRDPIEVLPSLVGIVREVRRLYSTDAGDLKIRMYNHIGGPDLDKMIAAGVHTGFGDEWVRLGAVKAPMAGPARGDTLAGRDRDDPSRAEHVAAA